MQWPGIQWSRASSYERAPGNILYTIFAAGCICYIALSIVCAKADGDYWTPIRSDGECWSEGGHMPYVNLGLWTGALMGAGFFGVLMLRHIHSEKEKERASIEMGSHYKEVPEFGLEL